MMAPPAMNKQSTLITAALCLVLVVASGGISPAAASSIGDEGGSNECTSATEALEDNEDITFAYEATHFEERTETNSKDDGSMNVFLDYTYSDHYQSVCEQNGGIYHGLYFKATCDIEISGENGAKGTTTMEYLEVTNFPRCYASVCTIDEAQTLFEEFTLRPTEAVNERHGKSYATCTGVIMEDENDTKQDPADGTASSTNNAPIAGNEIKADTAATEETIKAGDEHRDWCERQKILLEETSAIAKAFESIAPNVEQEALGNDEDITMISIDYSTASTDSFRSTCEESGFQYLKSEGFAMKCVKGKSEIRSRVPFFPICVPTDCESEANDFEALMERSFVHGFEEESKHYKCEPIIYDNIEGTCDEQTAALDSQKEIVDAFNAIQPRVTRLNLGTALRSAPGTRVLIEIDYDSNYTTDAFSEACEDSGFVYMETEGFAMDCVNNMTTLEYRVNYFPNCLGKNCNATAAEYDFETMKLRAFLHDGSDGLEDFDCVSVVYEGDGVSMGGLVFLYMILCIPCLLCHFCFVVLL